MKKLFLLITAFLFVAVTNLSATPIYAVEDNAISGSDMAGMLVTVVLENETQTSTWQDFGGNNGGAGNNTWTLGFNGSSTWFSNNIDDGETDPSLEDRNAYWEFSTNSAVSSFTINAIAANIVFDIFAILDNDAAPTGFANSEGSADGWWQENSHQRTDSRGSVTGTNGFQWVFSNPIAVGSEPAAGDLYGSLAITFNNPFTGTGADLFQFGVDSDRVAPIPEPTTIVLFGLGLLGLASMSRRCKP